MPRDKSELQGAFVPSDFEMLKTRNLVEDNSLTMENELFQTELCKVCESSETEFHFGGVSCRACAAFFRRYVHSKKLSIKCVCDRRKENSHACRHCRMIKCLKAGLKFNLVQSVRDRNGMRGLIPSISDSYRIVTRDYSKVLETVRGWDSYNTKRKCLYGANPEHLNLYEMTSLANMDGTTMWQMVESLFPQLRELKTSDTEALFSNFMSKFFLLESSHEVMSLFRKPQEYSQWNEENRTMLCNFYRGAMLENQRMQDDDILRVFWPFWTFYFDQVIIPIYERKNDLMESMAQLLLVLFDPAYINISEECASLCRVLRNMILRQLKGYHIDKNLPDERFFSVLDNLNLLEKADKKFQEEIQMCDLYNVTLHEDFRKMAISKKL